MKKRTIILMAIILLVIGYISINHIFSKKDYKSLGNDNIQIEETTEGSSTTSSSTTTSTSTTKKTTIKTSQKTTKKVSSNNKFGNIKGASKEEYMAFAKLKGGYNDTQMQCLDWLWQHESEWNVNSYNSESGACGIPQALPCTISKYYGDNSWENQIIWGVDYIKNRYNGNPCKAWNHWKNHKPHWY